MGGHGVQISHTLAALVHGQDMEVGLRWQGVGCVSILIARTSPADKLHYNYPVEW